MSEYWVSNKKYLCKYCNTYIADDAPSRQHHENGMRHRGNVERFVRGLYKAGEKQKKDREEELREMQRVERAAQAAFAQDVGAGHARASTSSSATSATAARPAPSKPAVKSADPYANYSTAASLGYTDPDAERAAAEAERRRTMGVVGDWEVVAPVENAAPFEEEPIPDLDEKPDTLKREAPTDPDPDDIREFKFRKKGWGALGADDYDPDSIPIKLKPKVKVEEARDEDFNDSPDVLAGPSKKGGFTAVLSSSDPEAKNTPKSTNVPKWTKISLKPVDTKSTTADSTEPVLSSAAPEQDRSKTSLDAIESQEADASLDSVMKTEESDVLPDDIKSRAPTAASSSEVKVEQPDTPSIKSEVDTDAPLPPPSNEGGGSSMFRKRKIRPAATTTGRRQV